MLYTGYTHANWSVYHAEEMKFLNSVVFIDDELLIYGCVAYPLRECDCGCGGTQVDTYTAKKIDVHHDKQLFVINPIEGADDGDTETSEEKDDGRYVTIELEGIS